eukprot:9491319-Pyramimonas_sp.AAC.1
MLRHARSLANPFCLRSARRCSRGTRCILRLASKFDRPHQNHDAFSPSCDWFSRWVDTASPPVIGSPPPQPRARGVPPDGGARRRPLLFSGGDEPGRPHVPDQFAAVPQLVRRRHPGGAPAQEPRQAHPE